MNIKWCPRPSKETHFRQSEKTAFHICGLSSGITTHFQPSYSSHMELPTVNVCLKVHLLSWWKCVTASELLPTKLHIAENPTPPSFPSWRDKSLRAIFVFFFFFWLHSMHSANLYCGATAQAPWKARSSSKAKCVLLDWCSWAAQGLSFASMSITLCNILRHDQVIPRDTRFIC